MLEGLPRNSSVLQTLIGPPTPRRGTTQVEKYRFSPPSARRCRFPTLELALWCFNLHKRLRTGRGGRGTFRHTLNPFLRNKKKSEKPCQRRPREVNSRGGV
ncbi:hypothetical protein TNIN_372831 [Trichonephila inaurata madagascariensis]|uniref:Uncharacterized protein n=1 Tax=Trichonephila inaurata madagascariensis TaxID=2747483 RepID=A0A8X6WT92_9ARAC|nr:hypothetical protein TNIN_372831 [Trichonephila inaurata madagascariensis]